MNIAIIGAGPSGLACAITLARNNHQVTIYEKMGMAGKKIIASGNGKCNLSNKNIDSIYYNNEAFAKKIIDDVNNEDLVDFLNSMGLFVRYDHEGRMYPYNENSRAVLDVLLLECHKLKIKIIYNCEITSVDFFKVNEIKYDRIVIATGGKSMPVYGSDGSGYQFALKYGHTITKTNPSLVPIFCKSDVFNNLEGLRFKAVLFGHGFKEFGEIQVKKNGISGIVTFNLTSYINKYNIKDKNFYINFIPDFSYDKFITIFNDWKFFDSALLGVIDKRLAVKIFDKIINKRYVNELTIDEKKLIYEKLTNFEIKLGDFYDYNFSQVTNGGISLKEINDNLESKKCPNLYFIGELLDVDGACGGYNMHMALATGIVAGRSINDFNS